MACNVSENKIVFRTICLRIKLKKLENKRSQEIVSFISSRPGQAAKMDNIENAINSEVLDSIDFKIKAIRRLLKKFNRN